MQNMNQFRQSVEAGMIALEAIEGKTISVRLPANFEGELHNGDMVKLTGSEEFDTIVGAADGVSNTLGMVAYNIKTTKYKANDYLDIFINGKIVFGKIGEAVNAGDELTWDNTNKYFVKKTTGSVDAMAFANAGANELSKVVIKGIM